MRKNEKQIHYKDEDLIEGNKNMRNKLRFEIKTKINEVF